MMKWTCQKCNHENVAATIAACAQCGHSPAPGQMVLLGPKEKLSPPTVKMHASGCPSFDGDICTCSERQQVFAVGDIKSDEVGSGARANAGKTRLDLIPVRMLRRVWIRQYGTGMGDAEKEVLFQLAEWQEGKGSYSDLENAWKMLDVVAKKAGVDLLESTVRVFEYGLRKYAAWNWAKGMAWHVPLGCFLRHFRAHLRGKLLDKESGESTLGHAGCNLLMLLHYQKHFQEGDDRPLAKWFTNSEDTEDQQTEPQEDQ